MLVSTGYVEKNWEIGFEYGREKIFFIPQHLTSVSGVTEHNFLGGITAVS